MLGVCLGMQLTCIEFARHVFRFGGGQLIRIGSRNQVSNYRYHVRPNRDVEDMGRNVLSRSLPI